MLTKENVYPCPLFGVQITEAGGRIPSFPQTAWRPSHPPAGGQWRGEAPNLDI